MRICFVDREACAPPSALEKSDTTLLSALVQAGHEVHLLRALGSPSAEVRPPKGVLAHYVDVMGGFAQLPGFISSASRWAWAVHERLSAMHRVQPFDWVDLPSEGGAGALLASAKRWGADFQEALVCVRLSSLSTKSYALNHDHQLDLHRLEVAHLEAQAIRWADVLRGTSEVQLADASTWAGRTGPTEVVLAPHLPSAQEASIGDAAIKVLYQGPLEPRQGISLLVEAACALLKKGRKLEFELKGSDTRTGPFGRPYSQWLFRGVPERLRAHIRLNCVITESAIDQARETADIYCFPALEPPLPPAFTGALAAGYPVLVSDVAAPTGLSASGGAATFRSGDPMDLAAKLEFLLDGKDHREDFGERSRQWVEEELSPPRIVHQMEALLAQHKSTVQTKSRRSTIQETLTSPAVSVIVPFYNLHDFLPETLASLDRQTEHDFEVVIVNDGSSHQKSHRLLQQLESERIYRIVHKPNGGLSSARNAGIAAARGRWILPLDADDLLAPDFIRRTLAVMRRDPSLAYATTFVTTFFDSPQAPTGVFLPWGLNRDALAITNVASTCTALLSRDALEEAGGYDEWLTSFEDWDLYCSLAERGHTGAVIPEFLFYYRKREGSLVHTEVAEQRLALMSHLIAKHPRLAEHPDRTLRTLLGEHQARGTLLPLRYRAVDAANNMIKRFPVVHGLIRDSVSLVAGRKRRPPAS